jgi:hypothetical protein
MHTETQATESTSMPTGSRLIRAAENPLINDAFCGQLRISLQNNEIPGVGSEVVATGIRSTQGHLHKTFGESYWVIQGSLTIVTYDPQTDQVARHELSEFDRLLIHPGTAHKVIHGSDDNIVLVRSYPLWVPGDEARCDRLESEFGADSIKQRFNLSEVELDQSLRNLSIADRNK